MPLRTFVFFCSIAIFFMGWFVAMTKDQMTKYHVNKSLLILGNPQMLIFLYTVLGIVILIIGGTHLVKDNKKIFGIAAVIVGILLIGGANVASNFLLQSLREDIQNPDRVKHLYSFASIVLFSVSAILLFISTSMKSTEPHR